MKGREIAERSPGDKGATGLGRKPRQIGQPAQGLVLGVDGTGGFQPAPSVDRRGADKGVEDDGGLGGGVGNESQVARMIDSDIGRVQSFDPTAQGFDRSDSSRRDRLPDAPLEFLRARWGTKRPGILALARQDEVEDVASKLLCLATQPMDWLRPFRCHLARKSSCAALATWSGERP